MAELFKHFGELYTLWSQDVQISDFLLQEYILILLFAFLISYV